MQDPPQGGSEERTLENVLAEILPSARSLSQRADRALNHAVTLTERVGNKLRMPMIQQVRERAEPRFRGYAHYMMNAGT